MFMILLLIHCIKCDQILTTEFIEGQQQIVQGWLDNSQNVVTSQLTCDESMVGPFLGEIDNNIFKKYSNISPHYEILITLDILFRGYWIQQNNYVNILLDGQQVEQIQNIQTSSFVIPNTYCSTNIVNLQPQKQNLKTLMIQKNHIQSDLQLDIQGSFWCSSTDPLACEKIALKNLVIITKECHQTCQTCNGPNKNNCLSCPSGSLVQGTCTCSSGVAYQFQCITSCPQFYQNQNGQCILECSLNCLTCNNNKCTQCITNYYNVNGQCYQYCPNHAIMQGQNCVDYSELSQYGSNYIDQFFTNGVLDLYQVQQTISVEKKSNSGSGQGQNLDLQPITDYYSIYQNKLLLGGFLIWSDAEYFFKYTDLPAHNYIVIYVTAYFIDNWSDDPLKIYVDGDDDYQTQIKSANQKSNLMLRNSKDRIENIKLSVKHTSSSLTIGIYPKIAANNYDASFAISDLFILADNCDNNCIECGSTACITCDSGYELVNKKCTLCESGNCNQCSTGFYLHPSNNKCKACQNNCLQCTSSSSCQQCAQGFYIENSVCIPCSQNCQACTQSSTCTTCKVGYILDINNQCNTCNPNQLVINNTCQDCSYKCLTCSLSLQNCVLCQVNRINPPLCNCEDGYYEEQNSCIKCSLQCETCTSQTNCIACAANRISSPLCVCPPDSFDNLSIGNAYCSTCDLAFGVAQFSENLQEIYIDFGQPIQNLQINCQQILTQEILDKIGQKQICYIRDGIIVIELDSFSTIQPGEGIQIIPYQLKLANCPFVTQNFDKIILNIPKKDIIPEIIFNTTLIEYSNCQDSFVQISKTVNDGGRPLKFLNWQVFDQNSNHFTMLEEYLNKNLNEPIITIPQNITFPQDSYTLTLTFTNFLNYRGQQSIQLQNYKGPVIISTFNNYSTYYNYQDINIFNDPYLLVCQSNVQYKNKTINLRISSQTNYLFKQLEILNQSVIDIGLEPYYFSFIGVYYITFDITIFYTLDQQEYSVTKVFIYQMEILEKEWVYQIQNQNRIIGFNQELSINLDIINPNNQTDQINFDIDWMCVNVLINKECKDSNGNFITFNNSQIQLFQERTFIPFQVIIITAQSIIGGKVYQSSTTIQFIETNLPQFKILINNQTQFEKINYYDEIYVELEYPIQKNPDDLYFTMQMGVDEFTTQSYRFYNYKLKFRVREKIQNLDYSTLNLKFSIYNPDFYVASTNQIQIYLNVPPKQCVLSSNTTGSVSLLDNILVTVKNCVDDEYPLKFGFVIYDNKDDFVQDQIQGQVVKGEILQNFSSSNNIVIRLYESDFNLIQVFVKDTYYGLSNFTLQFNTTYTNVTQDQILQIISQPKSKNQQFIDYMTILGYYTLEKIPIPQQIGSLSLNFSKNYTKFEDLVLDMDIQINYRLIHTQGFIQTRSQIDSYLRYVQDQLVLIDQNILNLFKYTVAIKYNSKMELLKLILIDRLYKYVNFISQLFYLNCELKISDDQNIINLKIVDTIDQLLSILTKIQFINDDTILVNSNMIQLQVNKLSRLRVIYKFGQIIDYSTSVSRQLTQSDQLEYIYNLAIYRTNPYQNSSEFKQSYSQSTQRPLYRPTLTLQGQPINQTLPVAYSFNHTETQLCVQKLNNLWQAQSCKTKVLLNETICVCEHISATTLVDAFFNAQGQIFRIFSYDSIQKIFNYEIEKIVFVYIVLFYTLTYIWLMYKSNQLDLMKTNPEEFNTKVHPTEKIDEQVIIHDNQLQLHEIETKTQISKIQARVSLKRQYSSNRLKAKEDTNVTFNNEAHNNSFHQKRLGSQQSLFSKNQQKKTEDKSQICQEDNFDIISPVEYLNSVEPQSSPKLFQKISSEDIKEQSTNLKQKIDNGEITVFKGLVLYFKYFHVFFGIYFRYCEEQNRILRCTLVYMSLLGQICILVVFGNQLNLNTILVLSFTQNVFGFIYKKLMSFLLNTNNLFIKSIGYNVTLLQCGLFYFIILASSCNYESIMVANLWAASYICSFFLDYFFYSSIIMVIMFIVNLRIHKYNNLKVFYYYNQKLSQIILDKPQYAFFFGE